MIKQLHSAINFLKNIQMAKVEGPVAENLLWYSPLLIALLLSPICVGQPSQDSLLYVKVAYELTQGNFDLGLRPGYIILLAGAFKVFGLSIWSATILMRVFFFANVALVFIMARYLVNKKAAFAASLTFLTSCYLNYLSYRVHLDNIHPFFILLAIFLSVMALDRRSNKLAVAAGLAFVYAYLVKSTAILFFPLPVLLVVFRVSPHPRLSCLRQAIVACAGIRCRSHPLPCFVAPCCRAGPCRACLGRVSGGCFWTPVCGYRFRDTG